MCNLRTIMMSATGKLLSDKVIDVGSISLNIIDAPAICICVEQNINGSSVKCVDACREGRIVLE